MRVLQGVLPTPEQLIIIRSNRPGYLLVRGAAGSGKTTSALLRLRYLTNTWMARRERLGLQAPLKVAVLTFNRTLRGYIEELARDSIDQTAGLELTISTFARWAKQLTLTGAILSDSRRVAQIKGLGLTLPLDPAFVLEEVDYLLGRFLPEDLEEYINVRRVGRGLTPRVNRRRLLDEVVYPYLNWKSSIGLPDWNDMAVELSRNRVGRGYDIVVADEVQDFSANQVRAITSQLAEGDFSATFVLDQAQQIYPRGFTWQEVGITINAARDAVRLRVNHRNTIETARFAAAIVDGINVSEDGTIPDFSSCESTGNKPSVLLGKYDQQLDWAINYIRNNVNSSLESVAFLHPKGWFNRAKPKLSRAGLDWVVVTRESDWPQGDQLVALSTFHSAKGLEFDHVFMLGLNEEVTREHGDDPDDTQLETLRKLFAMAVGRAKKSVVVGYKPGEDSVLIQYLDPATYDEIVV